MKRFIIISLMTVSSVAAFCCIWVDTHNYYLFSVYDKEEFRSRVDDISLNNWKAYLGLSEEESFWFDADKIAEAARRKGDTLMESYVRQLARYLDCVKSVQSEQYEWDYPSAEEVAQRKATLREIRLYAQGKLTTRLRSQHALLFMRCNMLLDRHSENVTFWEQTASKFIESVYRDMMENIYAGALLKTGQDSRAGQLFAKQGDWQSLMTQYYKRRSFQAISQEYKRDPRSAVLPFLLQDFVNNVQEAIDKDGYGKFFVRTIQRSEAQQMINFAGQVAEEGKTQHTALWLMAKAWLEYFYGNRVAALTDINAALAARDESPRIHDNARVLKLYISAMQTTPDSQYDTYVAGELQWLNQMKDSDDFYQRALDRVVHQALEPMYSRAGRANQALGLLFAAHARCRYDYIDSMRVDRLLTFVDYANSTARTPLDRQLKSAIDLKDIVDDDLIGTKYLRSCQWEKALQWLKKVPTGYYDKKGYAIYAARRSYNVEPWVKRQWLKEGEEYDHEDVHLSKNPKTTFATEMLQLEQGLQRLSGRQRQQRCYDLAIRYAQADNMGDCWFLMHDAKSDYTLTGAADTDLQKKAVSLLEEASKTDDLKLREQALFALAYCYLNDDLWYESKWDSQTSSYRRVVNSLTKHYRAWKALADFENAHPGSTASYVSRCDEYKQFRKHYRP